MGHRSAERIALHLLVERPGKLAPLLASLQAAADVVGRCDRCGSLAEESLCAVCADVKRDTGAVCVVEQVPDLMAIERSGAFRGTYHVLHGRLSPVNGVGPDQLNLATFEQRLEDGRLAQGRAKSIEYDVGAATVRLLGDAWLSDSRNEIRGDTLVYDIARQRVAANPGETDPGGVRITINPQQTPTKPQPEGRGP